jgi:hypothetical protein
MKLPRRNFLHLAAGAAALPAVSRFAFAQAYPARPVRIIVPLAPGGASDILARLVGQWLSERLGQQFVIDNRPGGGGNIGTEAVVRGFFAGPIIVHRILQAYKAIRRIADPRLAVHVEVVMVTGKLHRAATPATETDKSAAHQRVKVDPKCALDRCQLSTVHGTRSSLLRRRNDLPIRSPFVLILVHVTPRQRDGVDIFYQLDLEYRKSGGPK